jgi:hypothetical protein
MVRPQRLEAMKKHSVTDQAQIKFASAVRNYVPKVAGKLPLLMPFKEGIAELRRKHASYETIASPHFPDSLHNSRLVTYTEAP